MAGIFFFAPGSLEVKEQAHQDISDVPRTLWDAGYHHPLAVAETLTSQTLAGLIKQPIPVADRILSVCEKYASELLS